jgi:hypothetical protein
LANFSSQTKKFKNKSNIVLYYSRKTPKKEIQKKRNSKNFPNNLKKMTKICPKNNTMDDLCQFLFIILLSHKKKHPIKDGWFLHQKCLEAFDPTPKALGPPQLGH